MTRPRKTAEERLFEMEQQIAQQENEAKFFYLLVIAASYVVLIISLMKG
jgi:hypothetical protein